MENTLLITADDFTPFADICTNVDPDRINLYIAVAQRKHLRDVLGKPLYKDLLEKYAASLLTVDPVAPTEEYANLRAEILPFLCFASYAEYLPYSNAHSTPFGIRIKTSEFSEPVDAATLALMGKNAMDLAITYKGDLIDYLTKNFKDNDLYTDKSKEEDATRVSSSTVIPIGKCSPSLGSGRVISL